LLFELVAPAPTPQTVKAHARQLAASVPDKLRLAFARQHCAAAVQGYWRLTHEQRGRALRPLPLSVGAPTAEGGALGRVAAQLDEERAAYLIGSTYAAMLPDGFRATHGVFYTPPAVVRRLLDSVEAAGIDWKTCSVLDPACGGGAFLGPVADRMATALDGCSRAIAVRSIVRRLRGFEIDPFAAWISQVFLDATLFTRLGGTRLEAFDAVEVCDSLTRTAADRFDLVIGNPPYGRVTLPGPVREMFARGLYGHANLYGLFLDLSLRKARPDGGLIAFVTPTSFLSGEYFKRLRGLLASETTPIGLDFVSERTGVFDDVLQETALGLYRRGATPNAAPSVSFVEVGDTVAVRDAGAIALPVDAEAPWILPRTPTDVALTRVLRVLTTRLQHWGYRVSTGPLVWNRRKEQLRWKVSQRTVPLIWAESVAPDGTFEFRASRRNHAPYFLVREGDDALLVNRPCVLLQRTTAKEQARRLIAAELPEAFIAAHGQVAVENHLNMVLPTGPTPPVSSSVLAAFLNSSAADRAFRCISGSVAASAYELEAMPLPAVDRLEPLARAVAEGRSRVELDAICMGLYDL